MILSILYRILKEQSNERTIQAKCLMNLNLVPVPASVPTYRWSGCYSADISRVISDFGLCLHARDVLKRGHFPGSQERFNLDETMRLPRQVCKRPSRDAKGDGFMTSRHEQALRGRDGIPITFTTLFTLSVSA